MIMYSYFLIAGRNNTVLYPLSVNRYYLVSRYIGLFSDGLIGKEEFFKLTTNTKITIKTSHP